MPFHGPKEPKIQYASSRTTRRQTGIISLSRLSNPTPLTPAFWDAFRLIPGCKRLDRSHQPFVHALSPCELLQPGIFVVREAIWAGGFSRDSFRIPHRSFMSNERWPLTA
jgi:hypothetical protein